MKEEFLILLPLKTTTRGADIDSSVKGHFVEIGMPTQKLVSITTDGASEVATPVLLQIVSQILISHVFWAIIALYTNKQFVPKSWRD